MQVKGEAFDGNFSPASLDLYDYDWEKWRCGKSIVEAFCCPLDSSFTKKEIIIDRTWVNENGSMRYAVPYVNCSEVAKSRRLGRSSRSTTGTGTGTLQQQGEGWWGFVQICSPPMRGPLRKSDLRPLKESDKKKSKGSHRLPCLSLPFGTFFPRTHPYHYCYLLLTAIICSLHLRPSLLSSSRTAGSSTSHKKHSLLHAAAAATHPLCALHIQ